MKLNTREQSVQRSQDFEEQAFTINASAQAFKILSDGLYSNKIRAAIREICCNAWDAHIAGGTTDQEFEVTFPTSMTSIFKVRDFGTGLCHDDVMHLYTTYFASNKTDSDDKTGGFGLGSKSPFAYTDNFDVISYLNGEKRSYSAIIAENGAPAINLLMTEETEEPNGMEVAFPVSSYDIERFKSEGEIALRPFEKKPKLVGRTDLELGDPGELLLSGSDWSVFKARNHYDDHTPVVRMGNVDYPFPTANLTYENKNFLNTFRVIVTVPVGFVDPTPSRETLSMTPEGEASLNAKISQIIEELVKEANEEVAKCTGVWEARERLKELTSYNGQFNYIKDNIPWIWKGKPVHKQVEFTADRWKKQKDKISIRCFTRSSMYSSGKTKVSAEDRDYSFAPGKGQEFILDDYDKKPDYKVRNYIRHHGDNDTTYVLVSAHTKAALKLFLKEVGISQKTMELVTGLPLPPKRVGGPRKRRSKGQEVAFKLVKSPKGWYDKGSWWEKQNVDFSAGGHYVEIKRWQGPDTGGYCWDVHPSTMFDMMETIKDSVDIPILYGIKAAAVQKFKDDDEWVNVFDTIKEKLEEILKDKDMLTYWNFENNNGVDLPGGAYNKHSVVRGFQSFYTKHKDSLDSSKTFSTILEEINKALDAVNAAKLKETKQLRGFVRAEMDLSLATVDVFEKATKLYETYPMIKLMGNNTSGNMSNSDLLVDYINIIDNN